MCAVLPWHYYACAGIVKSLNVLESAKTVNGHNKGVAVIGNCM